MSPSAGPATIIGWPGQKPLGSRADFIPEHLASRIEWHGLRLAWSRATQCPCVPTNGQTDQADPSCGMCAGAGFLYFNDSSADDPALVGDLTAVQQKLCALGGAKVIRGIMTGMGMSDTPFERLGRLPEGQAMVTVRYQNRLGYLDRLVNLDAYIVHSEKVEFAGPGAPLPLRYLVDGGVNLLATLTTRFLPDVDFEVTDGAVSFIDGRGPTPGAWVTAHYNYHPQYLVVERVHVTRLTYTPNAKRSVNTPEGGVTQLPLQAMLRLDFLAGETSAGVLP